MTTEEEELDNCCSIQNQTWQKLVSGWYGEHGDDDAGIQHAKEPVIKTKEEGKN
jgi:hypothetical protein